MTSELQQTLWIAAGGGFVLSMFNLWTDSKRPKSERVPKDFWYWLFFVFWPILGAMMAWLYETDGTHLRPLLAFATGLSAPTTVQALITKAQVTSGTPTGAEK